MSTNNWGPLLHLSLHLFTITSNKSFKFTNNNKKTEHGLRPEVNDMSNLKLWSKSILKLKFKMSLDLLVQLQKQTRAKDRPLDHLDPARDIQERKTISACSRLHMFSMLFNIKRFL